jgi:hypothetical protein
MLRFDIPKTMHDCERQALSSLEAALAEPEGLDKERLVLRATTLLSRRRALSDLRNWIAARH